MRDETRFVSHGVDCAAWIYRPDALAGDPSAELPAIVMAHGFGCIRDLRLPAYAERFRDAGFVVVVFDYRHFGASGGSPRQLLDVRRQLDDWRSALAFTRALPGVDPGRVIAWGTSFSGGHVLTLAGTGERLAGVVAQVPHVSGPAALRATGLAAARRLAPAVLDDLWRSMRQQEPRYIPLVGRPGDTAVMTSADADPAVDRLVADSGVRRTDFRDDVAARIPHGRYLEYPCEHFDPYVDPHFEKIVADQLEFCLSLTGPTA